MQRFSNQEKANELVRELKKRLHVYPRLVAEGKMSQETATRQTQVLAEIAREYAQRAKADSPDLFAGTAEAEREIDEILSRRT